MKAALADTSFLVAFLSPRDVYHATAVDFMASFPHPIVTTGWVLVELGNFLCDGPERALFVPFVKKWKDDPTV